MFYTEAFFKMSPCGVLCGINLYRYLCPRSKIAMVDNVIVSDNSHYDYQAINRVYAGPWRGVREGCFGAAGQLPTTSFRTGSGLRSRNDNQFIEYLVDPAGLVAKALPFVHRQ